MARKILRQSESSSHYLDARVDALGKQEVDKLLSSAGFLVQGLVEGAHMSMGASVIMRHMEAI